MSDSSAPLIETPFDATHNAFYVRHHRSGKSSWMRIGSAWQHQDGRGFTVQLATMPTDGCVVVRALSEKAGRA